MTAVMTLSHYLKFKGIKLKVGDLAELTGFNRDSLYKMYKRDPSNIDTLLERYNEQLKEFKR